MTTLEALASRVDVYSIDEAFLDLTGIDRVVSFEPFGRQAIWLKVESPDGYPEPQFHAAPSGMRLVGCPGPCQRLMTRHTDQAGMTEKTRAHPDIL